MQIILYLCLVVLSLSSCSGRSQKKSNDIKIACPAYSELNKVLVFPDSMILTMISLPVSLDRYLKYYSKYPGYQPADSLISFLKTIEFEGSEYRCHLLPFRNKNILPMLLWISRGDNEYYLIVTVATSQGKVIDHVPVGESTDNGAISFLIDEDFNITQFRAQIGYNAHNNTYDIINKEMLNSYQIGDDGKIIKVGKIE